MADGRRPLRLAVIAAFPFPLAQGSQIFVRDQLRALARAGASATLVCYGSGCGDAPDDLDVARVPRALSALPLRAGPSFWKPVSDAALAAAYVAAHRRRPFDAALAHNGEAALAAIAARPLIGVPVVYVAHTLLARELPTWGPSRLRGALASLGSGLDRFIAGSCDGVAALCDATAEQLGRSANGPVEVIPPGCDASPAPDAVARERTCARFDLEPGGFALYSGNLDAYQDLDFLGRAAALTPELPVVVATHAAPRPLHPALRTVAVADYDEMRALVFAAGAAVLPRRAVGGFPIKLLGYMEAARPIIAVAGVADGLVHDRSAWLLPPDAAPAQLAAALRALAADPERARRLGAAAREQLRARHDWNALARRTLALAERARGGSAVAAAA